MKNHFPLLDPLRFGAAVGVAVFHQMFWSWAWVSIGVPGFERTVAADVIYPSAASFTWFGWVGVEIFFVISGFVIANSASKSSPTEFLLGRALRLYPAVWVCTKTNLRRRRGALGQTGLRHDEESTCDHFEFHEVVGGHYRRMNCWVGRRKATLCPLMGS